MSQTLTVGGQASTFFRLEKGSGFLQTSNVDDFLCLLEKYHVLCFFKNFLIFMLILQTMMIGILPIVHASENSLVRELLQVFGLVAPDDDWFTIAYIIYSVIFWTALFISLLYRYLFCAYRCVNKFLSVLVLYLRPLVDLALLPYGCSLFGKYLWMQTSDVAETGIVSLVLLIQFVYSLLLTSFFVRNTHSLHDATNPYYGTRNPHLCSILYVGLGLSCCLGNTFPEQRILVLSRSLHYVRLCYLQFRHVTWFSDTVGLVAKVATMYAGVGPLFFYLLTPKHTIELLWSHLLLIILLFLVFSWYMKYKRAKIEAKLSDPDYVQKVANDVEALSEMNAGLCFGNSNVLSNTFGFDLVRRFGNSYNLCSYMAHLSLWVANVSFPIETLASALMPSKEYSPEKIPFAKSMMKYFGPVTGQAGELYNRSVLFLREQMYTLLNTVEVIYSVAYDELSSNLPYYALQCGEQYQVVVRELLAFLQSYRHSPAGEYLVSVFQMVFPFAKELDEMKFWRNKTIDHVEVASSTYPAIIPTLIQSPHMFKSRMPDYSLGLKMPEMEKVAELVEKRASRTPGFPSQSGPFHYSLFSYKRIVLACLTLGVCVGYLGWVVWSAYGGQQCLLESRRSLHFLFNCSAVTSISISQPLRDIMTPDIVSKILTRFENVQKAVYDIDIGSHADIDKYLRTKVLSNDNSSIWLPGQVPSVSLFLFYVTTYLEDILVSDVEDDAGKRLDWSQNVTQTISRTLIDSIKKYEFFADNYHGGAAVMFCLLSLLILNVSILIGFVRGNQRFQYFITTLKDISKSDLQAMKSFLREVRSFLTPPENGTTSSLTTPFSVSKYLMFPSIFLSVLMAASFIYCILSFRCFQYSVELTRNILIQVVEHNEKIASAFRYFQDIVYGDVALMNQSYRNYHRISQMILNNSDIIHEVPPLCFRSRHLYEFQSFSSVPDVETFIVNWFSKTHLIIYEIFEYGAPREELWGKAFEVVSEYYESFADTVYRHAALFSSQEEGNCWRILHFVILSFVAFLVFACLEFTFVYHQVSVADAPFHNLTTVLRPMPRSALSNATLKVLVDGNWQSEFLAKQYEKRIYDTILDNLDEASVVVDVSLKIIKTNAMAEELFDSKIDVIGMRLFEALKIDFIEVETGIALRSLVERYLFNDCNFAESFSVVGRRLPFHKVYYKFSILPIMVPQRRSASYLALSFSDVSEVEFQKQNLNEQEEIPGKILAGLLPKQLADPLLCHKRAFTFDVPASAIAFIQVVPDDLEMVSKLFDLFDKLVEHYPSVNHIYIDLTTYVCGSGFFLQGIEPRIQIFDTLTFCLDIVERVSAMQSCDVRIGVAYGGPINASVLGSNKPILDLCGDVLIDAQMLVMNCVENTVLVDRNTMKIIVDEALPFAIEETNTDQFTISRKDINV